MQGNLTRRMGVVFLLTRRGVRQGGSADPQIFYHGGGAHSGAGYAHLAAGLRDGSGVAVYTPDIRGHGHSQGERGDAPSTEQLFRDVDGFVDLVRGAHPDRPLFVGGHSSGAGLVLNYATWRGVLRSMDTCSSLLSSASVPKRSATRRETDPVLSLSRAPRRSSSTRSAEGD